MKAAGDQRLTPGPMGLLLFGLHPNGAPLMTAGANDRGSGTDWHQIQRLCLWAVVPQKYSPATRKASGFGSTKRVAPNRFKPVQRCSKEPDQNSVVCRWSLDLFAVESAPIRRNPSLRTI